MMTSHHRREPVLALACAISSFTCARLCLRRLAGLRRMFWLAAIGVLACSLRSRLMPTRMTSAWHVALLVVGVYCTWITILACTNGAFSWAACYGGRAQLRQANGAAVAAFDAGAPAMLVAGGEACRDELGALLAACAPGIKLAFFSAGHYKLLRDFDPLDVDNPHSAKFEGVDFMRLQEVIVLDRNALDTLANFTSFIAYCADRHTGLFSKRINTIDVVVVTSAYHSPRASAVAAVVLGSRGLAFLMVQAEPVRGRASADEIDAMARRAISETWMRCARDVVRAVVWVLT
eukprot:CAMPEP_0117529062 /NCGR_PEP_ID=MMETSP0784-20121206/37639_1 /TAXON_ID=39447 /ORGANISM="" /LENGTH=290 /DNA_ID=CAMNT_0005325373 /DNA_START=123 /DNA_END=992 /DNA_ORIENTATION=+